MSDAFYQNGGFMGPESFGESVTRSDTGVPFRVGPVFRADKTKRPDEGCDPSGLAVGDDCPPEIIAVEAKWRVLGLPDPVETLGIEIDGSVFEYGALARQMKMKEQGE